jgi:cobalt-precorrin 5A hydrolase
MVRHEEAKMRQSRQSDQPEQRKQGQAEQQSGRFLSQTFASGGRRIAVIYLTPSGGGLARRLEQAWPQAAAPAAGDAARSGDSLEVLAVVQPLSAMLADLWHNYDGFVLIMAVGIVVRLLAPLLQSKWCDPGVVVLDEGGNFAVSLVGGHWGGANRLAREVAACLGAVPVVTTATDVQGKPAIDLLARQWGFRPLPGARVKVINSALLAGEPVAIFSEWRLSGDRPLNQDDIRPGWESIPCHSLQELEQGGPDWGKPAPVLVTSRLLELPPRGIFLRPLSLVAGIGCRRGVEAAEIEADLEEALRMAGRSRDSLGLLASHQIKEDEAGLLETAGRLGLALKFFPSRHLEQIYEAHPGLEHSMFVQQQLGVGNVCETAALAAAPDGTLVLRKTKFKRVTVALVEAGLLWSASGRVIRRI